MSLSAQILLSLVLGLATGLFFGERAAFVGIVGDAFILLLQMTVLPYVSISLISGLGSLKAEGAASLATRAGSIVLVLWATVFAVVLTIPLAFPNWQSASFFSTNLVEVGGGFDFLGLFIPSNPFHSLAESIVPSVVVFSVAVGIALIGIEAKAGLMRGLDTLQEAISRIATFVVRLAPIGVFAIATNAAGTLSLDQAASLQVYMMVFAASALVLALWTLPGLVAALTPYGWGAIMRQMRGVLLTAFATGNLFVVLSVLTERIKELVREASEDPHGSEHFVEVVVPVAFTLPSVGKLLSLAFVLFAGWISGYALSAGQYPSFLISGLASYFGAPVVAIPFLLDLFQIPADTFQLFLVADNVVGSRFGAMLGGMHLVAMALLASAAMAGQLRFRPVALVRYVVVTVILTLAVILGVRLLFERIGHEYQGYDRFVAMAPLHVEGWSKELDQMPEPAGAEALARSALDRILARGTVRVGYTPDRLPWAFRNGEGRLVGFDIEMADILAKDIGVRPEFVRVDRETLIAGLDSGAIDVGMTGIALTTQNLQHVSFSTPYIDETIAFVVRDHARDAFGSRDAVKKLESPVIAVPDSPYYVEKLRRYVPQAKIVVVDSPRTFFRAEPGTFDALLYTAESGSAWSLIYPQYTIAVPQPDILKVPLAYAVRRGDDRMVELLSAWLELKRRDRTIDDLFDHWILGKASQARGERWSVARNVLGWFGGVPAGSDVGEPQAPAAAKESGTDRVEGVEGAAGGEENAAPTDDAGEAAGGGGGEPQQDDAAARPAGTETVP